jgi:hypothetical protein
MASAGASFGHGALSGELKWGSKTAVLSDGVPIETLPAESRQLSSPLKDSTSRRAFVVPTYGMFRVAGGDAGMVALLGDSSCLDDSRIGGDDGSNDGPDGFWLLDVFLDAVAAPPGSLQRIGEPWDAALSDGGGRETEAEGSKPSWKKERVGGVDPLGKKELAGKLISHHGSGESKEV